ncbi:MAG TPA: MIP/aquaporin family protein [Actinomycetota bacterium]|nr:MIP/aquaporin family protein [Actinomycetota bacterium]
MERKLAQRLVVEFVGTLALVFIGVGAIISTQAGGALITVALAHGLAIAVMVSATGHISGGHFNPAVTIGAWVTQRIRLTDALTYVVAQLLGGAAGAGLIRLAVPRDIWSAVNLGTPQATEVIGSGQAVLIEAILAFFLVWVIFGTVMDPDGSFHKIAGLGIGLTIAMGIMMGGPFTGAAMNPARAFGPALVGNFWTAHWIWWVGPIAGGLVAALLYDTVMLRTRSLPPPETDTPPPAQPEYGGPGEPEAEAVLPSSWSDEADEER